MLSFLFIFSLVPFVTAENLTSSIYEVNAPYYITPMSYLGEQSYVEYQIKMTNCPFSVEVKAYGLLPADQITIKDDVTDPKNWQSSNGRSNVDLVMTVRPKMGYVTIVTSEGSRNAQYSVEIEEIQCNGGTNTQGTGQHVETTTKGSGMVTIASALTFLIAHVIN